jgi:hypothetical protein
MVSVKLFRFRVSCVSFLLLLLVGLVVPGVVFAAPSEPASAPTFSAVTIVESNGTPRPFTGLEPLPPGGEGKLVVQVSNVGDAPAEGGVVPIVIKDVLPEGLVATNIEAAGASCQLSTLRCSYAGTILPFELDTAVYVNISVRVKPGVTGELSNQVSVGGGGSQVVAVSREAVLVSGEPVGNGLEGAPILATNADGSQDTVAGSHPFQVTSTVVPDTVNTKDLRAELPAGLVGNTNILPQCSTPAFLANEKNHRNACPESTVVGVATPILAGAPYTVPLFNLVPSPGEPARFGFEVQGIPVILDASVRTGHGYGVTINVHNVPQLEGFDESQITIWGVPAQTVHNQLRGWGCQELYFYGGSEVPCGDPANPQVPFLTMPTSCTGPEGLSVVANGDTWQDPTMSEKEEVRFTPVEGLTGCSQLRFEPGLKVAPDGQAASTPTGLAVSVHLPQEGVLNPDGTAGSAVKSITVQLPPGVTVDPSGGDGLQACSPAQIGYTGHADPSTGAKEFEPEVYNPETGKDQVAPLCPDASKIGEATITTPLLPNPLTGEVYLAAPQNFKGLPENPFESLIAMYLVAEDPVSGVLVKLAGIATPNPATGQITATFESPQVPFENAEVHFYGSARAPLSTPASCGTYTTSTSIVPWSARASDEEQLTAHPSSAFEINTGPDGTGLAGCASPRQFAPSFNAETTNIQAGAFTPFTLTMTRPDWDQTLGGIEVQFPPGLLGTLAKVPLCPEPQASNGTCGEASLIGSTVVSAGLGGDPYTVTGGKVYITTGYDGAPYGLSIVQPAKAGPFVLQEGSPVIVRAAVFVDPHTAALRIVSGPVPTIIEGIPLQLQHINVTVERPGFVINPTNCNAAAIGANIKSSEGASSALSSSFQVTNCPDLKFEPKVEALVDGNVTKANGTSFTIKIGKPAVQGEQANLQKFKIELPKALPSRLTTLQKACTKAQFLANPAGCPLASVVGHMRALTPVLPVPVEGPLYFVSNGGEAFPNLVAVLQGYGITIDLTGTTYISKAGVTSSTFGTVPDVPFTFAEAALHNGPYSALTGLGDICAQSLTMPTELVAQNGTALYPDTKIAVTGCKPAITVAKHSVKGATATITVQVPAAGKLTATSKGLSKGSGKTSKAGTITVKLTLTKAETARLKKHRGRKLSAKIKLTFTPTKGAKLTTTTTVAIG